MRTTQIRRDRPRRREGLKIGWPSAHPGLWPRRLRYGRVIFSVGFEPKRIKEAKQLAFTRLVVDVPGRSSGVGVAHPTLELTHALGLRDGERTEGVSEVVEPDQLESGVLLR